MHLSYWPITGRSRSTAPLRKDGSAGAAAPAGSLARRPTSPRFGLLDYDPIADRLIWPADLADLIAAPQRLTTLADLVATVAAEDRDGIEQALNASLDPSGCGQFCEEFRVRRGDTGEVRWLSGRFQTLFETRHGRRFATRTTGIVEDITGRRRTDEKLLDLHDDFRGFLQLTNVGFAQTDVAARRFLRVNPALCAMTGYSEAELLALTIRDLDHPDDRHLTEQAFAAMTAGDNNYEVDKRYVRKDGSTVWVHVSGDIVRDASGAPVRTVALIRNVSERKRVEAALRESEERFRLMADNTPVILWVTDTSGAPEFVNREYLSYFGLAKEQFSSPAWPAVVHPEDVPEYRRTFQASLRTQTGLRVEARVRRADGAWRILLNHGIPRYSSAGEFLGLIGTSIDVTDQRAALHQERTAARQKDEFIAVLAHELRNPLAPIRAAAQLLRNPATHSSAMDRCATVIERQVAHMARLLEDLLDVSRLSRGTLSLRRAPLLLRVALEDAIEAARPLIEKQGQRLTVEGTDLPVSLDADPARITQVFSNLLNNASKYTAPGGDIRIMVEADETHVRVSIADTGIGIAPDMIERVFDLFSQVDRSAQAGLGVGLTLARRLVRLHGGTLTASSPGIGRGSNFVVSLPLLRQGPAGSSLTPSARPERREGRRVLIADDNADAADMLAMLFTIHGCEVKTANGGGAAVQIALEFKPELILLDIGMPDLDGYDTCRQIRAEQVEPQPFIVAVTGWGQDDDRRRSTEAGFDLHLVKPVPPELLADLLAQAPSVPERYGAPAQP